MEPGGFLDWPAADQISVSSMDDIGIPAPTNNLFTPFDSIFQMPFFSTADHLLQDPIEAPGRSGFANNTIPATDGHKDDVYTAVDDLDLADAVGLSQGDHQDSPVFGHGRSGTGSSDSTESIERNDESYIPIAPVIGNMSEKFSRLFEQCKSIDPPSRKILSVWNEDDEIMDRQSTWMSFMLTDNLKTIKNFVCGR